MIYKAPKLNKSGQPICEICEVGYDRLMQHVNKRHGLTSAEYKAKYNLNPRKGIQSEKLRKKMRKTALNNYSKVVMENLIIGGKDTRFKIGNTATDKARVSETSRLRMTEKWQKEKYDKMTYWERFAYDLKANKSKGI